jgi:hypothetical protein
MKDQEFGVPAVSSYEFSKLRLPIAGEILAWDVQRFLSRIHWQARLYYKAFDSAACCFRSLLVYTFAKPHCGQVIFRALNAATHSLGFVVVAELT